MTRHVSPAPTSTRTLPTQDTLPGWPEILVGLAGAGLMMLLVSPVLDALPDDEVLRGIFLAVWSPLVPAVGFLAAVLVRFRSARPFGVRRTTWRWILVGTAMGIVGFLIKGFANMGITALTGYDENVQTPFMDATRGGLAQTVVIFGVISFIVPMCEEFLFRGVLMRGLLRYGPWIAVLGSSIVFALFHGLNLATPSAFVFGLITAELARRSGSLWPGIAAHCMNNLGVPILALVVGASATS